METPYFKQMVEFLKAHTVYMQNDKISKVKLKGTVNKDRFPLLENHEEYMIMSINMSPTSFWDKYLANGSPYWIG